MTRKLRFWMRISDQERRQLTMNAKAANMTPSAYVRQAAIYYEPEKVTAIIETRNFLQKSSRELCKQGTNLNQIAAFANTYKEKSNEQVESLLTTMTGKISRTSNVVDKMINQLNKKIG